MKVYRYRIYPNKAQEQILAQSFGNARFVYNWGLAKWLEMYKAGEKVNKYILNILLPDLKKENGRLNIGGSQTLQQATKNLDSAFKRFFKKQAKHPRFKSKYDKQSITYPQFVKLEDGNIKFPKIGQIKTVLHTELLGNIKKTTITKTATGKYFASILTDYETGKPTVNGQVGIDMGIKVFATLSDGTTIENPHFLKKSLRRLAKAQKDMSRKVKGSSNRNKSRLKVACIYEKISNQRQDFLHKHSTTISRNYGLVAIENLNIKGMIKNKNLARSISDVGRGTFFRMLQYKCDRVVKIDRFAPSSKACSNCGEVKKNLQLSERIYQCDACGFVCDRDLNASKNILTVGITGIRTLADSDSIETDGSKKSLKR